VRGTHLGKGVDHGKMVRRTHPTLALATVILMVCQLIELMSLLICRTRITPSTLIRLFDSVLHTASRMGNTRQNKRMNRSGESRGNCMDNLLSPPGYANRYLFSGSHAPAWEPSLDAPASRLFTRRWRVGTGFPRRRVETR
jgi:hypothetical protein